MYLFAPRDARVLHGIRVAVAFRGAGLAAEQPGKRRADLVLAGFDGVAGLAFGEDLLPLAASPSASAEPVISATNETNDIVAASALIEDSPGYTQAGLDRMQPRGCRECRSTVATSLTKIKGGSWRQICAHRMPQMTAAAIPGPSHNACGQNGLRGSFRTQVGRCRATHSSRPVIIAPSRACGFGRLVSRPLSAPIHDRAYARP